MNAPLVGVLAETLACIEPVRRRRHVGAAGCAQRVLAATSTEDRSRAYGPVSWQGGAAKKVRGEGAAAYLPADRLPVACHRGIAA